MRLSAKKFFLIGFVFILLIGIPITIYFLQKQQEIRSRAEKSTILTFTPESSQASPIQKSIGDSIPLDVMVNPGTNLVSFVKLSIQYDPDKLATESSSAFVPNTTVFPTVLEGPVYSSGKVEVTLSVGPDPTKAIQTLSKAGTLTLKAVANTTDGQPTLVTYSAATEALSIGSGDQASENVLSSTVPATIVIGGGGTVTPTEPGETLTPIPPTLTPTSGPTSTPLPTTAVTETPTPTPTIQATTTPTSTPVPTVSGSANQVPVCNSLAVDRATTGAAPFSITFTANGTDSDGTISKVNFNFGDGAISGDITTSGGIGTNSVNVATSHTYNNAGTYTASAVLTDNSGGTSNATSCQQTILVQAGENTPTPTSSNPQTPTPTMAPSGSVETAIGIGAAVLLLIIGGGLILFAL